MNASLPLALLRRHPRCLLSEMATCVEARSASAEGGGCVQFGNAKRELVDSQPVLDGSCLCDRPGYSSCSRPGERPSRVQRWPAQPQPARTSRDAAAVQPGVCRIPAPSPGRHSVSHDRAEHLSSRFLPPQRGVGPPAGRLSASKTPLRGI